jgi:hypothetical protein
MDGPTGACTGWERLLRAFPHGSLLVFGLADFGVGGVGIAAVVEPGDGNRVAFTTGDLKRQKRIPRNRFTPERFHDNAPVTTDDDFLDKMGWNFLTGFLYFSLSGFHRMVDNALDDYLSIDLVCANLQASRHYDSPQPLRPTRTGRLLVCKTPSALTITSKSLVAAILIRVDTKLCAS